MRYKLLPVLSFIVCFLLAGIASYGQTTLTINVTPGDTICAGTTAHFHGTASVPGPYHFNWMVNGTVAGPFNPNFNSTTIADGDTVWCVLTNVAGDTVLDTSNYIIMSVIPAVIPSAIAGPDSVCLGSTITVMDSVSGGTWHSANNSIFTVSSTGVITPVAPGNARVVYQITTGVCTDSVRLRIRVQVPAGPIIASATTICQDSVYLLRDTARGGIWTVTDASITAQLTPFGLFQAFVPGTTTVIYNVNNACGIYSDTITITVINCDPTAVGNVTAQKGGLNIYPNPSTGIFAVSYTSDTREPATITINNLLGAQVAQTIVDANQTYNWNLEIPSGMYFITSRSGNKVVTEKLIINR